MGDSPFAKAISALLRPLEFAARDDFAHTERVVGLPDAVREAASRGAKLAIPRDTRRLLEQVERAFAKQPPTRQRIGRALERLAPLGQPEWADAALARPVASLAGVGPKRAEMLARRGLRTISDLLFHFPLRYDDRRQLSRVEDLEVGRRATFVAQVQVCDFVPSRTRGGRFRRTFRAMVGDETGNVSLRWFHAGDALRDTVRKGATLIVTGDVRRYRFDKELIHPEVERVDGVGDELEGQTELPEEVLERLRTVVPEYSTPEGIPPRTLRSIVARAVEQHADLVASHLPEALVHERELPEAAQALREIHAPDADVDPEALAARRTPAHERLILEELYTLEVGLALRRAQRAREPGIALQTEGDKTREAPKRLPFTLTQAQRRVWGEIQRDLERPHPMNRLLQGDVGSGKTVLAFLSGVAAAESGYQTALMAPTELLAEQHARTLGRLIEDTGSDLRSALLVSSLPKPEANRVRERLATGELDLVVGTHALVQGEVRFSRLALAVVDEQHRFGVLQRQALSRKAADQRAAHVLVMTATPIPRTLALTVYGDLDVSVLDEMPPGRTPVATHLLREGEGERVIEQIQLTAARGEQIYVVYPLVEESEKVDLRAATESARKIQAAFPDLSVDLVHGRLDARARAEAMDRFVRGETQILVSTSVIEVGVDVANATLMVVEHAERFGLAQLHQLRGRVGRGRGASTCLLVARGSSEESEARLAAMLRTTDGFEIAEADLQIRGPGEFLGTRQHGKLPELWVADLVRDARWVATAREAALETVRRDPKLRRVPGLARAVRLRWRERLALADVG